MKTIIIVATKNKYFWPWVIDTPEIQVEEAYKKQFKLPLISKLKKRNGAYQYIKLGIVGKWKKTIKDADQVIFLDSSYSKQFEHIIRKMVQKEGKKVIFFYWNKMHLNDTIAIQQLNSISSDIEFWSYNMRDSIKFGLKYNTTMYYFPAIIRQKQATLLQDVFFGGWFTNDRISLFDEVLDQFKKYGITYYIDAAGSGAIEKQPRNFKLKKSCFSYAQYLQAVQASKAILNLDKYPDMGCSLRALEALWCEKKYITNNQDIVNEKFYTCENIFILGKDDIGNLRYFLQTPYKKIDKEVINYYSLEEWAKRFAI